MYIRLQKVPLWENVEIVAQSHCCVAGTFTNIMCAKPRGKSDLPHKKCFMLHVYAIIFGAKFSDGGMGASALESLS